MKTWTKNIPNLEILKLDLLQLLKVLEALGCLTFIYRHIATLDYGLDHFSRLLRLHTWLFLAFNNHSAFIDNNLFWERGHHYRQVTNAAG